jgi:hypothetical protein
MPRLRVYVAIAATAVAPIVVPCAAAADQPISAVKLVLQRSASGREQLKDGAFLFPGLGSQDDPGTGTPGGVLIEIASLSEPGGASLVVPPGTGRPGWTSKGNRHRFVNAQAPAGPSPVKLVLLEQGKGLSVVSRSIGLSLGGPRGAVGIRITTGTQRNCVFFAPSTVRTDTANHFVARGAIASALSSCDSLLPASTTTSTTTTTTTTLPSGPVCGNGIVETPEECDTSGCPTDPGLDCAPPGQVNECTCCLDNGQVAGVPLPCCDPDAANYLIAPLQYGCFPSACSQPSDCYFPTTCCLPGTSCFPGLAGSCCFVPGSFCGYLYPCCTLCMNQFCCKLPGDTCSSSIFCCSGSCSAGVCN